MPRPSWAGLPSIKRTHAANPRFEVATFSDPGQGRPPVRGSCCCGTAIGHGKDGASTVVVAKYVKPSNFCPPQSTSNPTQARRRGPKGSAGCPSQAKRVAAPGHDFLKRLEFCITYGNPFLFEAVEEALDPIIDPVLERQFTYETGRRFIRLGDKLVEWDDAWGRPGGGVTLWVVGLLCSLCFSINRGIGFALFGCTAFLHTISVHGISSWKVFSPDRPQPQVPAVPVHEDQSPQLPTGSLREDDGDQLRGDPTGPAGAHSMAAGVVGNDCSNVDTR